MALSDWCLYWSFELVMSASAELFNLVNCRKAKREREMPGIQYASLASKAFKFPNPCEYLLQSVDSMANDREKLASESNISDLE